MGTDQYHEPPDELPQHVRTFARMCASLVEEAEAIGWYEIAERVLFQPGPIVERAEVAEEEVIHGDEGDGSLGIGGRKGDEP